MIPEGHKTNFETLQRAVKDGAVALMECYSREGEPVYVVCAHFTDDDGNVNMVPLAQLFNENPYDTLASPTEEGAFVDESDDGMFFAYVTYRGITYIDTDDGWFAASGRDGYRNPAAYTSAAEALSFAEAHLKELKYAG